jgi:hypothetical protein
LITSLGTDYAGYRVWSAPTTSVVTSGNEATYSRPYYGFVSGGTTYSYVLIKYDHKWSIINNSTTVSYITNPTNGTKTSVNLTIDTTQEMQVFNGFHQTRGTTQPDTGYLDYSTYQNNTLNYSNVNKSAISTSNQYYRFATFAWKYNGTGTGLNTMVFKIIGLYINTSTPVSITQSTNGCYYINNNSNRQRFFIDYRVEEIDSNSNPIVVPTNNTCATTIWVDGNTSYGTINNNSTPTYCNNNNNTQAFSTTTYYTPNDNSKVVQIPTYSMSYSSGTLTASLGSLITNASKNYYIFVRIGLPMVDNYGFKYVTLSLNT